MICPNKNSAEWKSLVSKYGEKGASRIYVALEGNIDNILDGNGEIISNEDIRNEIENKFLENKTSPPLDETIKTLESLSTKFNIPFEIDNSLQNKGEFNGGKVIINPTKMTADTMFHEFAHPFVQSIKQSNPKLYNQLAKEVKKHKDIVQHVEDLYSDYTTDEKVMESIVQAVGLHSIGAINPKSNLNGLITRFLNWVGEVLGIKGLQSTSKLQELGLFMHSDTKVDLSEISTERTQEQRFSKTKFKVLGPRLQKVVLEMQAASNIYNKAKTAEKIPSHRESLQRLENYTNEVIDSIADKKLNHAKVIETGNKAIEEITKHLTTYNITESYLHKALDTSKFWANINSLLYDVGQSTESSTALSNKANNLANKLLDASYKYIQRSFEKRNPDQEPLKVSELQNITEDFGTLLKTVSKQDNRSIQYLDQLVWEAAAKREASIIKVIDDLRGLMKKAGLKEKDLEVFLQKDNEGFTGNMIGPVQQAWYDVFDSLRTKRMDSKEAMDKYVEFLESQTLKIDVTKLDDASYYNELLKGVGNENKKALDSFIKEARQLYKNYLEEYSNYKIFLESDLKVEGLNEQQQKEIVESQLKDFQEANDPRRYFEEISKDKKDKNFLRNFKGYRFLTTAPLEYQANGKKNNWFDSQYNEILQDTNKAELYNFLSEELSRLHSYLPRYIQKSLDKNYLVQMEADFGEKMLRLGMEGKMKVLNEWITKQISSRRVEIPDQGHFTSQEIPLHAFNRVVPIENRNTNLVQLFEATAFAAYNYKFYSEIESDVLLLNNLIQGATDPHSKSNADVVKRAANFTVLFNMYNQRRPEGDKSKMYFGKKKFTERDKKRKIELETELSSLTLKLKQGQTTQEEFDIRKQEIETELESLGMQKSVGDFVEAGISLSYAKAFGYNPFPALANFIYGTVMNHIEGARGEYFTHSSNWAAKKLMVKSIWDSNLREKIKRLMVRYGVVTNIHEADRGIISQKTKKKSILTDPMGMFNYSEYSMKSEFLLSYLIHNKITDKNGNEVSFYDAYDADGRWNNKLFTDKVNKEFNGRADKGELGGFIKQKGTIFDVMRIHGNFDPNAPALYKANTFTRAVAQFRFSWLVDGFYYRFGAEGESLYRGTKREGIYRSVMHLVKEKGVAPALLISLEQSIRYLIPFMKMKNIEGLTELQARNLRATITELNLMSMAFLVIMFLRGFNDDEESPYITLLINQAIRTYTDTRFYMNMDFLSGDFEIQPPMLRVLSDGVDFFNAAARFVIEPDMSERDKQREINNLLKAMPHTGGIRGFMPGTGRTSREYNFYKRGLVEEYSSNLFKD